jgi:hypothetical protein
VFSNPVNGSGELIYETGSLWPQGRTSFIPIRSIITLSEIRYKGRSWRLLPIFGRSPPYEYVIIQLENYVNPSSRVRQLPDVVISIIELLLQQEITTSSAKGGWTVHRDVIIAIASPAHKVTLCGEAMSQVSFVRSCLATAGCDLTSIS